jgi:hypothetical protein
VEPVRLQAEAILRPTNSDESKRKHNEMVSESNLEFTPNEVSIYYAARVPALNQRGSELRGPCPIHQGHGENFAVESDTGRWYCHSRCGKGGDILDLEMALTGVDFKTAKSDVYQLIGRAEPERWRISRLCDANEDRVRIGKRISGSEGLTDAAVGSGN